MKLDLHCMDCGHRWTVIGKDIPPEETLCPNATGLSHRVEILPTSEVPFWPEEEK